MRLWLSPTPRDSGFAKSTSDSGTGAGKVSANSTNTASKALGGVVLLAALQGVGFRYDDGLDGPTDVGPSR
jgi:hypothetical protein